MKILITGGAGFIGANLCEKLLSGGHEIFCADNFYSARKENISDLENNPNFKLIKHDIIHEFPKELSAKDFDQIYHLACPASPIKYQKDHLYTLDVNYKGTLNVLNLAKNISERSGKKVKVLFSSTSEVYGDPLTSPQNENYRGNVNPHGLRSCYDEGKRVAESLCMNFWRKYDFQIKIVRIFNTYGPRMDPKDGRAVSNFIVQALKGENITIYGDGKQTRSFQYIEDLIDGMISYMNLDKDFPGPINLGNPNEITILNLANTILKLTNSAAGFKYSNLPEDDPLTRCPDISLAKEKLNWEPKVNLESGLEKTIEYFKTLV